MTDEELLRIARNGEEHAFRALYERYRDSLFRFGYRLTGSAETAEDLVHDCFVALLRSPGRFDSERASLRTYLYSAVRNLVRKHFRDAAEDDSEVPDIADEGPDPVTVLIHEETARIVKEAIAAMPVSAREVVILADYEELSMAEIAEITGAEIGAVRVRLHRARQSLKRALCAQVLRSEGEKYGERKR